MILCSNSCIPCCDYCEYVVHEKFRIDGDIQLGSPLFCQKYNDEYHNKIVGCCGYCTDFYCKNIREKNYEV